MIRVIVTLTCVVCLMVLVTGPTFAARALTAGELTSTVGGEGGAGNKCVKVGCAGTAMGCCLPGVGGCTDHGQCNEPNPSDCVEIDLNDELGECQAGTPLDVCWEIRLWCIKYKGGETLVGCTCNQTCFTTYEEAGCIPPADPPPGP